MRRVASVRFLLVVLILTTFAVAHATCADQAANQDAERESGRATADANAGEVAEYLQLKIVHPEAPIAEQLMAVRKWMAHPSLDYLAKNSRPGLRILPGSTDERVDFVSYAALGDGGPDTQTIAAWAFVCRRFTIDPKLSLVMTLATCPTNTPDRPEPSTR